MTQRSIPYSILRPFVIFSKIGFYRKYAVSGLSNLPKDKPYILAPNHQNAFMDPIMVAIPIKKQLNFLVRADIFQKDLASKILHAINMMPVYRMRDGVDTIDKNEAIFKKCYNIISKKWPLMIFPEGNHNNKKHLRSIKKGIGRIAFGAEEANNFELDIQIIPVGINYSNHTEAGATLLINFGEPITTQSYKEKYLSEQAKALTEMRNELHKSMSSLIIDIKLEYYTIIEDVRKIFEVELGEFKDDLKIEFKNSKTLISNFQNSNPTPEKIEKLETLTKDIKQIKEQLSLKFYAVSTSKHSFIDLFLKSITLLLSFPFFLYGFIHNAFQFHIPNFIVKKKIKDDHFHSSIKMALGLVLFPLVYLVQVIIFFVVTNDVLLSFMYLISLPLFGYFALKYWYYFREVQNKFKVNLKFNSSKYQKLVKLKSELYSEIKAYL